MWPLQLTILALLSISVCHAALPQSLLHKDECLFVYVDESVGNYEVTFNTEATEPQHGQFHLLDPPELKSSTCATKENNYAGKLIIPFKPDNAFSSMRLEFSFRLSNSTWEITNSRFIYEPTNTNYIPNGPVSLTSTHGAIYANSDESYSCSSLVLQNLNPGDVHYKLTLKRFQMQPFQNPNSRYVFAKSHDCSNWLTLPQIMGFALMLFIIFTTLIGVYLLMELGNHTSDLKYSKQGGMLLNQAQLDATKAD